MQKTTFSASTISLLGHALQDVEELQQLCKQGVTNDTNNRKVPQDNLGEVTEMQVLSKKEIQKFKIPERISSRRFDYVRENSRVEETARLKERLLGIPQSSGRRNVDVGTPDERIRRGLWTIHEERSNKDSSLTDKNREPQHVSSVVLEGKTRRSNEIVEKKIHVRIHSNDVEIATASQSSRKLRHSQSKHNHAANVETWSARARPSVPLNVQEIPTSPSTPISTSKPYITNSITTIHSSKPLSSKDSFVEQVIPRHIHGIASCASSEHFLMSGALSVIPIEPLSSARETPSQSLPLFEKLDKFRERTTELRLKISDLKGKDEAAVHESARKRIGLGNP